MASRAEQSRLVIEKRGDLPKRANAASGWFAVFPAKWKRLQVRAAREGRDGPCLVLYRTNTGDDQDHYVVPASALAPLLTKATAPPRPNGKKPRWELQLLEGDVLRVTHGDARVNVAAFRGLPLDGAQDGNLRKPTADMAELERRTHALLAGPLPVPRGSEHPRRVVVGGQPAYERLPEVRAWVLKHADRRCELCGLDAPFVDEAGRPFLEVHHVRRLADGGPDRIDNAVALCPNCHRRLHHAADAAARTAKLVETVSRLASARGRRQTVRR